MKHPLLGGRRARFLNRPRGLLLDSRAAAVAVAMTCGEGQLASCSASGRTSRRLGRIRSSSTRTRSHRSNSK